MDVPENDFRPDEYCSSDGFVAHIDSGYFINTEWWLCKMGRSWTGTGIDPVLSLCALCVYASPSSLSSVAKDPQGLLWCVWVDPGLHTYKY